MQMMPAYSSEAVKTLVGDTLRLFVGHKRRFSWADLATATGDKETTLRSYVAAEGSLMPLDCFMRVFTVLPPEAFARVARHMGFSAAPEDAEGGATMRRVISASAHLVAQGTAALEDGQIDHREMAALRREAEALLPAIAAVVRERGA